MQAAIAAIEYFLPGRVLTTADLAAEFPEWAVEKIDEKTGIRERHIAAAGECASDLAVEAAKRLFASGAGDPGSVDFILFCTQSPDYFLPSTACLIQDRLGIRQSAGALDFSLGSSGFVYGLGLAQGLITSRQAAQVLLLTGETYSKYIHPRDRSVRTIFGDGATATLLERREAGERLLGPFVYGTDGSGGMNLVVPAGASREACTASTAEEVEDGNGNVRSRNNLFMDGAEIFNFTLSVVPRLVQEVLEKAGMALADVDLIVFHQANRYILEHLRKRMKIPADRFYVAMSHCGNTGSSTIPIALKRASEEGRLGKGSRVLLVGFGPGYSWGATLVRWTGLRS